MKTPVRTTKKKMAVNPTKQHSMKCPKLYGKKCLCDGYHTFEELYNHRIAIWIRLLNTVPLNAWRSKLHSDGTSWEGWFICGLNIKKGRQMTYHLPMDKWKYLDKIVTLDKAPEFDGHTPDDVIERLLTL